ncbi:LysR family transcriptional regulator [Xanthomonas translucens]|uniref:LysR family transcriptional regulator n=1 Tax=Xanthomonas campestris pv. translucens TaxID=343 RepID=UPI00071E87AA|nr:LysR family transcriptional regulator [Xanthomonas translucens]QEN93077.1 LysR family transcriptional regulator [Xanthomonas translucens pv. undulosa]
MDLRPTDLPLLVSLDTLLELKNVTRAAQRLHMSQPALSSQLARLRVLFKDPLLTPSETGRGMVATPMALALEAPLRDAIGRLSLLGKHGNAFDPSTAEITFRIAGSAYAFATLAASLVCRVHACGNPAIGLSFVHVAGQAALEAFENGDIDVLLDGAHAIHPSLRMRSLSDDRYVMAQRHGHPRGSLPPTMEEYCALQHVQLVHSPGNDVIDVELQALGLTRQIAVKAANHGMLLDILAHTDMVATVPACLLTAAVEAEVAHFELPFALPDAALAMAWHRRSDGHTPHRWLRECVLAVAEASSSGLGWPAAQAHATSCQPPASQA